MPETMWIAIRDAVMTFYPIKAVNSKTGKECFSFFGVPDNAKGKFLPQKAKQLGCIPNLHFKKLTDSQSVIGLTELSPLSPQQIWKKLTLVLFPQSATTYQSNGLCRQMPMKNKPFQLHSYSFPHWLFCNTAETFQMRNPKPMNESLWDVWLSDEDLLPDKEYTW